MRLSIFLVLITIGFCSAQVTEFKVHTNGLIYDEKTMNRLGVIVDSLNLKFRTCDLSHPYYSVPQGLASFVSIPSKTERKQIESGISFEDYANQHPFRVKRQKVWITANYYINYDDKPYIEYSTLPGSKEISLDVKDKKSTRKNNGWVLSDDGENAVYLHGLSSIELPQSYGRLVQYVDCMIDTNATIFFAESKRSMHEQVPPNSKAQEFISWAESFPGKPEFPSYDRDDFDSIYHLYARKHREWDSLRLLDLDKQMMKSIYRKSLLIDAFAESQDKQYSSYSFEFYVGRYLSSADALKLMRSRRVVGYCSQDQSPRFHAMSICQLAAETAQWDIFLRSHLDIMNDRFERQSDGSYAWAERKTYLQELEELDIKAVDLLIGTTLRVKNVSKNHYFSSINRTGRALADTEDKDTLENRLLAMIQDEKLDPYNRILLVYLFDNYAYNLEDEAMRNSRIKTLDKVIASLPDHMRTTMIRD